MRMLRQVIAGVAGALGGLAGVTIWILQIVFFTEWLGCLGFFIGFSLFLVGIVTFPIVYWVTTGEFSPSLWALWMAAIVAFLISVVLWPDTRRR